LSCKQCIRSTYLIGAAGKKIHGKPQPRELDLLPEGDEASVSEFVPLVQFLDNFEIIFSGNVDRPGVPGLEDGFEPREFRRADQLKRLQSFPNAVCVRVVSPELCEIAAEDTAITEINQVLKQSQGSCLGDSRQW